MKPLLALALAAIGTLALLAQSAVAKPTAREVVCGPKTSLLLWPKGYKAYPLPDFEIFAGWAGPYGVPNLLAYATAANDGALGYPATQISPNCINYGSATKPTLTGLAGHTTMSTRLACSFPSSVYVEIDKRPGYQKDVRVIMGTTIVANASVTPHGSRLDYATQYCKPRLPLLEPTS
jgi:hypothetical protein